jgi:hypothetical protein
MTVPWRERPRDLTGSAITPAATEEVAHATLSLSQPEQAISSMRPAQSAKARTICTVSSSAVGLNCAVRSRALKALRVASLAHARLTALTARSANRRRATIDGRRERRSRISGNYFLVIQDDDPVRQTLAMVAGRIMFPDCRRQAPAVPPRSRSISGLA